MCGFSTRDTAMAAPRCSSSSVRTCRVSTPSSSSPHAFFSFVLSLSSSSASPCNGDTAAGHRRRRGLVGHILILAMLIWASGESPTTVSWRLGFFFSPSCGEFAFASCSPPPRDASLINFRIRELIFSYALFTCSSNDFKNQKKKNEDFNLSSRRRVGAGFAGTHESWGPQVKGLTGAVEPVDEESPAGDDGAAGEGAEVCCFDNRGIGRSSVPPHKSQYT
jgi:hypothetical protein